MITTPTLAMPVRYAPCFFGFFVGLFSVAGAADFRANLEEWQEHHQSGLEAANALSMTGDTVRGNQLLINLADQDGGGVAAFIIANMLYRSEPAVSYRLHARALKALPHESAAALEMAMEQHRKGEYAAAIVNYRKCIDTGMGVHFSCLLADCLIHTGQLKEAVMAWEKAGHGNNHTKIDFAIFEIYGPLMPVQRRGDLVARIKAGDLNRLAELIELDLNFDRDWWNSSVFEEGLDLDLKLAEKLLGKSSPRYQQLAVYAQLARQEEKKADDIRQTLTAAKLVLGKNAVLPENSHLARGLCELAMRNEAVTAEILWQAYEPALRQRLAAKDRDALHLLCLLAVNAKNGKLAELDRLGWKEWQDPEFAVSYISGLAAEKKITRPDDQEILDVLKVRPSDSFLAQIRVSLAGEGGLTQDLLVAAITAEYHRLSTGMIIPDSYTLKGLFYELRKKLGMPEDK